MENEIDTLGIKKALNIEDLTTEELIDLYKNIEDFLAYLKANKEEIKGDEES